MKDLNISNKTFLKIIFGKEWQQAHVTAFHDDPSNILKDRRGICWGGGLASNRLAGFSSEQNQYFTISTFNPDDSGKARRKKSLFDATFVIVADDVAEKIPVEQAEKLPAPTYKLNTSKDSEQWGWVLAQPVDDADNVNNLLDGLVARGLAPDGTDPGMKGVTRYVRLPEGSNTKQKRIDENGGTPYPCRITEWEPTRMYSLKDLAVAFNIDLDAPRNDKPLVGIDVNSGYGDKIHPVAEILNFEGEGVDGWLRLEDCPNGDQHTDGDLSGAAVQFLPDGRINFMCHHGHCNGAADGMKLTGPKAIALLEKTNAGITERYETFQRGLVFDGAKELAALLMPGREISEEVPGILRGINPADYFYVTGKSLPYFDRHSQTFLSKDNLDAIFRQEHSGTKASPTASKVFEYAMDRDNQVAHGVAWLPTGWQPTLPVLIEDGKRKLINTWAGVALTPVEGDVTPWLDLVAFVVPNERERNLLIQWMAYQVQNIGEKCNWQIVLLGEKGVGKDQIFAPLARILGDASGDISAEELQQGWGDYIAKKKLLLLQEVYRPQNKGFANTLKTLAADTANATTKVNMKGGSVIEQANVTAMVLMSNHKSGFTLEKGERRYFVLNAFFPPQPPEYYQAWGKWMGPNSAPTDASAKVFNYLLNLDLSDFDPTTSPYVTDAAFDLIDRSDADYVQELRELEFQGVGPFDGNAFTLSKVTSYLKLRGMNHGRNGVKDAIESMGYTEYRGC